MYSKIIALIRSNGSHFLTAGFLRYCTYKVTQKWVNRTELEVTMYTKYTAHINLNGSHFLMAWFLVYCTFKVKENGYIGQILHR